VIGCARHALASEDAIEFVEYATIDLADMESCRRLARGSQGITHLFYAARASFTTGRHEGVDVNTLMFRNILDALEEAGHPLEHVHMVHGTKYYGSTEGPWRTPASEDAPRVGLHTFYYEQEDIVNARRGTRRWRWTSTRPHAVCDSSLSTPRSLPLLIAAYATICRQQGEPLFFPGTVENFRAIYQATDAGLLARAIVWMATEPRCADQAFNVTNGDFIRWDNLWPVFARDFGMEPGPVRTIKMADVMPGKSSAWREAVARHGLVDTPYERMVLWSYGDFIFTPYWDMMSSTMKLRRFGFNEVIDTEQMFLSFFADFRKADIVPQAAA
jgi:nucleoside-diphosphate-sugar epimerase